MQLTWLVQLKVVVLSSVDLCVFILTALSQSAGITCFNSWPFLLNCYSDATEDALQKVCGPQCTVCGLHSHGRIQRGFDIFIAGSV